MPAAAVIPAPIAYIKVVAVKKLVVGSQVQAGGPARAGHCSYFLPYRLPALSRWCSLLSVPGGRCVYFEKIRVFKAGLGSLNNGAWNNGIGPRFYLVGSRSGGND